MDTTSTAAVSAESVTDQHQPASASGFHIAAVSRDTGIPQDTLRVWERRYGFPQPLRDANGERLYPQQQLDQLHLIQRLLAAGHRPGRILPLSQTQLHSLLGGTHPTPARAGMLEALQRHDAEALQRDLTQELLRLGLASFVIDAVAPLVAEIGLAWRRGELKVFEEHLFSETLTRVLRTGIGALSLPASQARPRVLLTTTSDEPHGLGLLMVEALLALEGCACVPLGVQTPIEDIRAAAVAHGVDAVVLSFSSLPTRRQVLDALSQLRVSLPEAIAIWVGGSSPALNRVPSGVVVLRELQQLAPAVAQWRQQHAQRQQD